jgi:hypothetical protein
MAMDPDWKPRCYTSIRLEELPLQPEEVFVLTRLDGRTDLRELATLTRLTPEALRAVLQRLVDVGALHAPGLPGKALAAPGASAPGTAKLDAEVDAIPEGASEDEDATTSAAEVADVTGTHRKLFEAELHMLAADERVARAAKAAEPYLSAFCYDPLAQVIKTVLANPKAGLGHARLIAQHHRTPDGLAALATRGAFLTDAGVRRWLIRNPQLPVALFNRLFAGRRMLELFQVTVSREVTEPVRRLAREALRRRFAQGPAEERVELILRTEGRVLPGLGGIPIDGRTTALLCGRTYSSTTLVQNIARWSAAPPALIRHLLKQETIRRSPSLRMLLQRHPNAPSEPSRG